MNNKSNICVVGAGRWGMNHVRTLTSMNSLGGVVEFNETQIKMVKTLAPDVPVFKTLEEALEQNFEGYTIATPPSTHHSLAKTIMEASRHVMTEKPLTLTVEEAEDLYKISQVNKVNLMVGHVMLFHPAFMKIKEMIDKGMLGKLQYMYSNRLNMGTLRTEENVFWSFAPHDIALFEWFAGASPTYIQASGSDFITSGVHDTTITSLKYPNHISGHIFVSWLHPFKEHRFVIIGDKGMLCFEDNKDGKPLMFYDKHVEMENNIPIPKNGITRHIEYDSGMPLTQELQYFIDHCNGTPLEKADAASAVETIKVLAQVSEQLT